MFKDLFEIKQILTSEEKQISKVDFWGKLFSREINLKTQIFKLFLKKTKKEGKKIPDNIYIYICKTILKKMKF